ncbi:amino acid ABC transporter permease [Paraburkholderia bryophila]|uniref:Polar amino acid transport system permease protein n=1 Tax=Paraburkholderia bryophila TaxID=420952 RepID=A0A7Z0BBN0_9BURK|nr:polar amino acid transport system permease protein [Paraburkholderia bryophila]
MNELLENLLPFVVKGLGATIFYSLSSASLGFVVAVIVCSMRLTNSRMAYGVSSFYVSMMRGVPLIVQLLIAYYCLPELGINVSPVVAAISTLGLCSGAYQAEILRGGFLGIPGGQIEAARMGGLSGRQILLFIQIPQAVRLTFPALINEATNMVKASSLISVVGVLELTRLAQNIAASTYKPLPAYAGAGLVYLAVTTCVAAFGKKMERKLAIEDIK